MFSRRVPLDVRMLYRAEPTSGSGVRFQQLLNPDLEFWTINSVDAQLDGHHISNSRSLPFETNRLTQNDDRYGHRYALAMEFVIIIMITIMKITIIIVTITITIMMIIIIIVMNNEWIIPIFCVSFLNRLLST